MDGTFLTRAERYAGAARRRRRRLRTVTVLASLVVFCTTYALILPAITMEHICGMTEHTHTVDCYTQLLPPEDPEAVCGLVENEVHQHGPECYDTGLAAPDALTCENEDPDHVHGPLCYGTWQLTCPLPEHLHDESCNADAAPSEAPAEPTAPITEPEAEPDSETAEPSETLLTGLLSLFKSSGSAASVPVPLADSGAKAIPASDMTHTDAVIGDTSGSGQQVNDAGGTNAYDTDGVAVSKTLTGTELENVFDITLTVKTPTKIEEIVTEPDMAVVIVMDISNTMTYGFGKDNKTGKPSRYDAAMEAASDFLDNFAANNTLGVSKVGFVAFNTNAHQVFALQKCTNASEANALKSTMSSSTSTILTNDAYPSHNRFTNMEAGLQMARDMLAGTSNKNKFIIFLTDGFPTTYIKSGYNGYDPYDTSGRFYDHVFNRPCQYGTDYSNEAAIRAKSKAAAIRADGTTIFSIGVDIEGQTIQQYIDSSNTDHAKKNNFSTVDRTNTSYEIGGASDTNAFKSWLGTSIGSGYYYDSTNTAGLKAAYADIFQKIKYTVETNNKADWVATDPIPDMTTTPTGEIEFIGLFDKDGTLLSKDAALSGKYEEGAEDTASYNAASKTISWDLKASGYTSETVGHTTTYTYRLKYRVRLKNEEQSFVEHTGSDSDKTGIYLTNNETYLRYKVTEVQNGVTVVSESRMIAFPIPAVHGFLGELTFQKVDQFGAPLENVTFTLSHADNCDVCHGDNVPVPEYGRLSDQEGTVYFDEIPSGHTYTLTETVPDGYAADGNHYRVTVTYDKVTVTVYDCNWQPIPDGWTGRIVNHTYYELPATGGSGTLPYTLGGLSLLALAGALSLRRRRREAGT